MNELGLTLAWCAVQVSLLLIPTAALYAWASRRSPVSGAWVASLGLGLVVALSLLTFVPRGKESSPTTRKEAAPARSVAIVSRGDVPPAERPRDEGGR